MAKAVQVKVELYPVSLKAVAPAIPKNNAEKDILIEDLTTMGCEGLLLEPWALKIEAMVQELQEKLSNEWEGTIRRLPERWTADLWAEVYGFRKEGRMKAQRNDTWINGKFDSSIDPKNGYAVSNIIDPRERRVLEFVVPILYPEKPGRVTKEIGNTIFRALCGEYKVSWGQILHEVVDKLVSVLGKGKPTPINPYLFHLYNKFECLRGEEIHQLKVAKECLVLGVASKEKPEEEEVEVGSDRGSLSPREQLKGSPSSRLKTTFWSPKGKEPIRNPDWKDMSCLDIDDDPFRRVHNKLDRVQSCYSKMEIVIKGASKLLRDCKAGNICKELKKLREKDTTSLEVSNAALTAQV